MPGPAPSPEPAFHPIYGPYRGREPRFYPPETCPWIATLEAGWKEIRWEVEAQLRGPDPFRPNFDPYGFHVTGWRSVNFQTYLRPRPRNMRRFPITMRVLASIPRVSSAFVNVLEPHSRIPPHAGDSNTVQRTHLGLIVPGDVDDCGIQVGGERRGWREGRAFAFCDAHEHSAWNATDALRVVLVVDVMKPEYWPQRRRICGEVRAAIALRWLETRFGLLSRLPRRGVGPVHRALGLVFRGPLALPRPGHWRGA